MKKYKPISLKKVKTYSLKKRKSKVSLSSLAAPFVKGETLQRFFGNLPDILAVKDFKAVSKAIIRARENKRHVILGMGAHPIKVGLSPVIIDLMEKGVITAFDANGNEVAYDLQAVTAQAEADAQAIIDTKTSALAKLASLGLTTDEIKALLGAA